MDVAVALSRFQGLGQDQVPGVVSSDERLRIEEQNGEDEMQGDQSAECTPPELAAR